MKKVLVGALLTAFLISGVTQSVFANQQVQLAINGRTQEYYKPLVTDNGTTLVPLNEFFGALGGLAEWDNQTKTVHLLKGDIALSLQIGNNLATLSTYDAKGDAYVNPKTVKLKNPPKIMNETIMVPLREISTFFGAKVSWDATTGTINVTADTGLEPDKVLFIPPFDLEPESVNNANTTTQPKKNALVDPNKPIDQNGVEIKVGDRVSSGGFYGQVQQVNGGRILVFWDSKSMFVPDQDVDFWATVAGVRYKASNWINANELEVER
jgi:hypothetical protein